MTKEELFRRIARIVQKLKMILGLPTDNQVVKIAENIMTKEELFRRIVGIVQELKKISGSPTNNKVVEIAEKHGVPLSEPLLNSSIGNAIHAAWTFPPNALMTMVKFEKAWEEYNALPNKKKEAA